MELTLKLSLEKVNILLASLGKMPYEAVFQLVDDLRNQVGPQIQQDQSAQPQVSPPQS
jgi:hypothetical protein